MQKTAFIAALALLGAGCAASARIVVLQHPDTKQTVDCRVDGSVTRPYLKQENCINAYEKVGYRVVSDSDKN
ncbi:hypothetical protein [Oryzomicrobium sp.]|uniref:hypothetical protein n=1 Tax=Oryzomicrobium sp. TaxID=1911578 RepID=UPI002FE0E3AE